MVSTISLILVVIPIYLVYSIVTELRRNITAAKRSGLPYVAARLLTPEYFASYV